MFSSLGQYIVNLLAGWSVYRRSVVRVVIVQDFTVGVVSQ